MIASFRYRGYWWSPKYQRRVPGELTYSPERGLDLSIEGSLTSNRSGRALEFYPVVLRRAIADRLGPQITLLHVRSYERSRHGTLGRRLAAERLRVQHALFGAHLRTPEEWTFDRAELEFEDLGGFVDIYAFDVPLQEPYTVKFAWPDAPTATVPGGTVSIGRVASQPMGYSHDLHLTETAYFDLKFSEKTSVEKLHSAWLYPLQNLLTLAARRPTPVTQMRLFNRRFRVPGKRWLRPLTVFFNRSFNGVASAEDVQWSQRLFRYTDIEKTFGAALCGWLVAFDELRSFCEIFFGERYHPSAFYRSRILALMLALETLHRATRPNIVRPKAEFKSYRDMLVAAVPEPHREWLRKQLAYSNEPRLRDRIFELITAVPEVLQPILGDLEAFANEAARTRNSIVHRAGQRKRRDEDRFYWLTQKLEFICEAHLVSRLGFANSQLLALFERNEAYRILKSQSAVQPAG